MNQTENSLQEEQDSPLDLTVNRTQEQNTQQGKYPLSAFLCFDVIYYLMSLHLKINKLFLFVLNNSIFCLSKAVLSTWEKKKKEIVCLKEVFLKAFFLLCVW